MVENIRQNWLGQKPTVGITVGNHWAMSCLTRKLPVEHIRQNWLRQVTDVCSCSNEIYLMFSTIICLVSHDIAQ
jgi:hypothetical protein